MEGIERKLLTIYFDRIILVLWLVPVGRKRCFIEEKRISKQPLYDQLVELLKEKIETEMTPNCKLPSEREICIKYGLSRTTVRLALQELESMGYIYRQHGKGTFVSNLVNRSTNLKEAYSFTEQMKSLGKEPKTQILEYKIFDVNKYFANHLCLSLGDKAIKIKRLRLADGLPMMLERTYLPYRKFVTLSKELLEKKPLYDIFKEDYQENVKLAEEEFYASIVSERDSKMLDVPTGAPSLNLRRTSYNMKNDVIEYTLSVARADQFIYKVRHYK